MPEDLGTHLPETGEISHPPISLCSGLSVEGEGGSHTNGNAGEEGFVKLPFKACCKEWEWEDSKTLIAAT